MYICKHTHTCVHISEAGPDKGNKWVTGEYIHFNSTLWSVMMIGAGDLMVKTTIPVLKKLINLREETANNNSRKYS